MAGLSLSAVNQPDRADMLTITSAFMNNKNRTQSITHRMKKKKHTNQMNETLVVNEANGIETYKLCKLRVSFPPGDATTPSLAEIVVKFKSHSET